jgi:hypothetical protein
MTLGTLLGGKYRLRVPGYQRAYAWSPEQAGQLLDDVLFAIDADEDESADYFLGAVVLMRIVSDGGEAHDIVDGLQRLVTLTILLAVLRDIAEDDDTIAAATAARYIIEPDGTLEGPDTDQRLRLSLPDGAQSFLLAFVQEPRATAAMPDDDDLTAPEARMLAVREHLMASLVGQTTERRRQILNFLIEHCHCAVLDAQDLDRAHQIFAVLNDRGLPLARGDILKAQLLGAVSPARRTELHNRWIEVEKSLGGSLEELFSHLRTIEGRSRARIIDEIRDLVRQSGSAEAFIERTLVPYAGILATIRTITGGEREPAGRELPQAIASRIAYLGWLGSQDWVPPLMLYWRLTDGRLDQLDAFLVRLDRLAYGLRILGVGSDKRATRYRAVMEAIRTGRIDEPDCAIELGRDEQRLIAYNLRTLHARSQLLCKLVLLRLNDLIAEAPQRLDPAAWTVEHILPQKPARASQWREWFPTSEERERCTQSLGNLILVSRDKNEKARNLELAKKIDIYFGDGADQPALTREVESATTWQPADVQRREESLLALLERLWQSGAGQAREVEPPAARSRPRTAKAKPVRSAAAGG